MIRCLALLLLALAQAAAAEGYNVGFRQLAVTGTGESFPLALFYPTAAVEAAVALGPYTLPLAMGAGPAAGRFGLIVISHGTGGSNLNHHDLAMALARAGSIVAAPQHPRDNYRDHGGVGSFEVWAGRPRQLSESLDAVLADAALGPLVDPARIGAVGHSAGGYTVLAALGGKADMLNLREHCRTVTDDASFCSFGGAAARQANRRVAPLPDARDPRIKAAVVMAPLGQMFTPVALAGIDARLRVYAGEHDALLVNRYHAAMVAQAVGPRAEYREIANAGHFSFLAPFPPALAAQVGEAAQDLPGFDRAALHRQLNQEIVAFFAAAPPR